MLVGTLLKFKEEKWMFGLQLLWCFCTVMSSVVLCGSTEAAQVSTPVPVCECNCDYRA